MTREDIIRMAREAWIDEELPNVEAVYKSQWFSCTAEELERFAALVAAHEREACAKVCEDMRPTEREFDQRFYTACTLNANAIRARSNT